jgi:hypothetical protein
MGDDTKPTKTKRAKTTAVAKTPATAVAEKAKPALPAIPRPQAVADVKATLEVGAAKLKDAAPKITDLVLGYAMDPTSEHHEWAAKLVAERLFPARGYAQPLVSQAGGIDGRGPSTPVVYINITEARGPHRPEAEITVAAIERPALPDEDPSDE